MALLHWNKQYKNNNRKLINAIKEEMAKVQAGQQNDKKERMNSLKRQLTQAYKREEIYWGQKARIQWLKEGDRNTKYFHAVVEGRRKRNNISTLQKENGTWCESEGEIEGEINAYFNKLFTSNNPKHFDTILSGIPQVITGQMNNKLTRPVSEMEVKKAVFSLHPNKAPGPDGMTPSFFQNFWDVVKKDLIDTISSFFHSGHLLKAINETIITLIPKVESPISVSQFRPISLCNVVYRIISKILVNRLKPLLNHCVSGNQSAFVPGRQIIDNIVIAHESIHCLNQRRTGSNNFMALKLDMAKAYDRVEWLFVIKMMERMGFCQTWINWIFKCISSVVYSFNVNGEKKGFVRPSRGIRQGDPLSPYLFLLVSEGLSSLLLHAMRRQSLSGLKIAQASPAISHLFFADDTLIFCRATTEESKLVMSLLKTYEEASGQMINIDKSAVFFSKNTGENKKSEILRILGGMAQVKQSILAYHWS